MKRACRFFAPVLISMLSACGGGGGTGTTAFSPVVSMNANISASEPLSTYSTEYAAIYADGAHGAQTAAPWNSLETTPDPLPVSGPTYDLTMVSNPYFGLDALAGYGYTSILINIPIVAINARKMPADIATNLFSDQTVKDRYHALLDLVLNLFNGNVQYYVSLGNEVDTYFNSHTSEVSDFKTLIDDARNYIHQNYPNLNIKVGVTTTFDGYAGNASAQTAADVASLNQNMDVIILTYYPTSTGFVPRDPSTVGTDMAQMVAIAAGKPLVMQEWGYPSSAVLSPLPLNAEQMQADFITNTFASWKQYGSSRIPFISFFKRRDWDTSYCGTITGQTTGQPFYEFMCSLGLMNNDNSAKLAYTALTTELSNLGP